MRRRDGRRGNAILEFTLVGIPLIFVCVSIVQMALGMWNYDTLQYAVKAAGAYASVHGSHCLQGSNSCVAHLSDTAQALANSAIGLPPDNITVTFTAWKTPADAAANTNASTVTCRLDNCINQAAYQSMQWPPNEYNNAGYSEIEIRATYSWHSAMVAPGASLANAYALPAYSRQVVMF